MSHMFDGLFCRKQRKLAKIWRQIARRHLSRIETPAQKMERANWTWADLADGESDP